MITPRCSRDPATDPAPAPVPVPVATPRVEKKIAHETRRQRRQRLFAGRMQRQSSDREIDGEQLSAVMLEQAL